MNVKIALSLVWTSGIISNGSITLTNLVNFLRRNKNDMY